MPKIFLIRQRSENKLGYQEVHLIALTQYSEILLSLTLDHIASYSKVYWGLSCARHCFEYLR